MRDLFDRLLLAQGRYVSGTREDFLIPGARNGRTDFQSETARIFIRMKKKIDRCSLSHPGKIKIHLLGRSVLQRHSREGFGEMSRYLITRNAVGFSTTLERLVCLELTQQHFPRSTETPGIAINIIKIHNKAVRVLNKRKTRTEFVKRKITSTSGKDDRKPSFKEHPTL
jgi:hypothetical protein